MGKRYTMIAIFSIIVIAGIVGYQLYIHYDGQSSMGSESEKANKKINEVYDVIVIGGEPEGVAGAVSAARNGAKTLLVESRNELGGLYTYGMLNFLDIPQGKTMNRLARGFLNNGTKWLVGECLWN